MDDHCDGSQSPTTVGPNEVSFPPLDRRITHTSVPGYEILGELGTGGMGIVYKARQVGLDRIVALKMILHPDHAGRETRQRFRTEAEAVARLQHPNVVQIFEVGECAGVPYFSLEFCPGGNLASKLNGTPQPPLVAAPLMEKLARAVQAAHEQHIVHRDLKPANVLLTSEGEPKVSDFGLAKKLDERGQTQSDAIIGTPSYMAPEQASGQTKDVGPAADVYALGAILYQMLTGSPPFRSASTMETLQQVIFADPVAIRRLQPDCPRDLETICLKCLEKQPVKRYVSANELADDLQRFQQHRPIKARPLNLIERGWRWCRRNPVLAASGSLTAVALLAIAAFASVAAVRQTYHAAVLEEKNTRIDREQEKTLAALAEVRNQKTLAETRLRQVLTTQQTFQDHLFTSQSERQRLLSTQQLRSSLDAYLSAALDAELPATQLYSSILPWKGAVALRHTRERVARDRPELRSHLAQLATIRSELSFLAFTPPQDAKQQADWSNRFDHLENERELLEIRVARQSDNLNVLSQLRRLTPTQVAQALPKGTVLIDFYHYRHILPLGEPAGACQHENRLLGFILERDRPPICVPLGDAGPIRAAVLAYSEAIRRKGATPVSAKELRRLLWNPLHPHLARANTVLVAPDEPLYALSFAALPGANPDSYLLEEFAIGYVSSAHQLLAAPAKSKPDKQVSLLAVGDVDYDRQERERRAIDKHGEFQNRELRFMQLPGTRQEIQSVVQTFRQAFPKESSTCQLTGADADKDLLTRQLSQGRWHYLHLATHGWYLGSPQVLGCPDEFQPIWNSRIGERNPQLQSALVFAGVNRSLARGILTADEVAGLDLRGVELAVLAACDTGYGRSIIGEGVLGLQRAFLAAGSRSVMVSLWSIDDLATVSLMQEFYTNLWQKKLTAREALRQAQLKVLLHPDQSQLPTSRDSQRGIGLMQQVPDGKSNHKTHRGHPSLWAPFVLFGDLNANPSVANR